MKVIYTGASSLAFHSAPSAKNYVFFPGVALEVAPEDEQFFRNKSSNPGNPWRVEGVEEVVAKSAADTIVDAVDSVATRLGGGLGTKKKVGGKK